MPNTDCQEIWDNCLSIIRDNVTAQNFKTWFKHCFGKAWTTPDTFHFNGNLVEHGLNTVRTWFAHSRI